ncbi:MAG: sulfite exporter TauE/SafE family protein [Candidatus Thorarchaeota archaeon]
MEVLEVLIPLFILAFISEYGAATLGMGYGTTLAPILIIAGYEPLMIVPTILFSQFFAGFIAAGFHHKFENVNFRNEHERKALTVFILTGIGGVIISVFAGVSLPAIIVKLYIAAVVLITGLLTLMDRSAEASYSSRKLTGIGIVAAFNKGLSGGGYGPIVIAGGILCGIKPRAAVAITALVEGIICAVGVALYFLLAVPGDIILMIGITAGAIVAAPFSALTTAKLRQEQLKRVIAVSIVLIGIVALISVLFTVA